MIGSYYFYMSFAMLPLAKGILTAFIMTLGVGPGMLINFHASLRRGFIAGLAVVAGLYLSDAVFIIINYFSAFHLIGALHHQRLGGIAGGAVLCVFGVTLWLKRPSEIAVKADTGGFPQKAGLLKGFLSGFVVNITNPFVFIFWMTLMSIATLNFGFRTPPFFVYFAGVLGTALCLDIVKSYLFSRLKNGIKTKVMAWINHGIGTVLTTAGMIIICRSIVVLG